MKYRIVFDSEAEEEVVVYAKKRTSLTDAIEELVMGEDQSVLYGKQGTTVARLPLSSIDAFCIEDRRLVALVGEERWYLRERLRSLEESLPNDFVRIHQSCIINLRRARRFEVSIGGALRVVLANGYSDYVSRRQLKTVKERVRSLL